MTELLPEITDFEKGSLSSFNNWVNILKVNRIRKSTSQDTDMCGNCTNLLFFLLSLFLMIYRYILLFYFFFTLSTFFLPFLPVFCAIFGSIGFFCSDVVSVTVMSMLLQLAYWLQTKSTCVCASSFGCFGAFGGPRERYKKLDYTGRCCSKRNIQDRFEARLIDYWDMVVFECCSLL